MLKYYLRTCMLIGFLSPALLSGQQLTDSLNALHGMIKEVQIGTDNYQQKLTIDQEFPYRIKFVITEVDKKGKTENLEFQINLALIDANLIRYEDGKDQIRVNLRSGKEPVIKIFEDGELKGYDNEAYLLAFNIDNAREIERILQATVPLAKAKWEEDSALPTSFEELKSWVQDHVKSVTNGDDQWEQLWSDADTHPCRIHLETKNEKGDVIDYRWNLADIHPPSISVGVKGKEVRVEMGTSKKARYVQVDENGERQNYESEVELIFDEVDDAQVMAHALRKLVALSEEKNAAQQTTYNDTDAILKALQDMMPDFRLGENDISQSLEGDCQAALTIDIQSSKGGEQQEYVFDFADLHSTSVEIEVKGQELMVAAKTANNGDYIYYAEDGEQKSYTDKVLIATPDLPTAKKIQYLVEQLAEQCSDEITTEAFPWIAQRLEAIKGVRDDFTQELSLLEKDPCKWVLIQREVKGNSTDEERYEFNLYDLDARRVELNIKGKEVMVGVPTLRNEEIIKNYSNNEELGYAKELVLQVSDVATGKVLVESLRKLIEGCEE